MQVKRFFTKTANLLGRLSFYCLGFVDIYYCVKYLVILPNELNSQANKIDCLIVAGIQLGYWIFTIIAEQITNRLQQGLWDTEYFERKRTGIKLYTLIYIILTLALGYVFLSFFFSKTQVQTISFYNADENNTIDKLFYGIEFSLSVLLCCYLIYLYRSLDKQINGDGETISNIRQQFLNVESINSNDNDQDPQNQQSYASDPIVQSNHRNNQEQAHRFTLSESFDQRQAQFHFDQNEKMCTICYDNCTPGQKVIELPCLHTFHSDCIRKNTTRLCPNCRETY